MLNPLATIFFADWEIKLMSFQFFRSNPKLLLLRLILKIFHFTLVHFSNAIYAFLDTEANSLLILIHSSVLTTSTATEQINC